MLVSAPGSPGRQRPAIGSAVFCQQDRIQFSKVATSQQAAFMAAIKAGPSVWA